MSNLPSPKEADDLLSKIYEVVGQRISSIQAMANLYKVSSRPFQCLSKTVFQVRDGEWGMSVYKIETSSGVLTVPTSMENGWPKADIIDFLENFEAIRACYAEDIERAYGVLRNSPMWIDAT